MSEDVWFLRTLIWNNWFYDYNNNIFNLINELVKHKIEYSELVLGFERKFELYTFD